MTKQELNHRHTSKYGILTEINRTKRIDSLFIKHCSTDLFFRYEIKREWVKSFGPCIMYLSSPDVYQAEETISDLLREHKLF